MQGMRVIWAGLAVLALAGCDGEPFVLVPGTGDAAALDALLADHAALSAQVAALPLATAGEIGVGTGATFTGTARIDLATQTPSVLAGTATIFADFDRGTVSGNVGGFTGQVDGGLAQPFGGTLVMTGGTIGAVTPSGVSANLDGVLTSAADVLAIDGGLVGDVRSDAAGVAGISAGSTADTDFTLDGAAVAGAVTVVTLR